MRKICIFDIDGVLNYYPDCWVDFINIKTGKMFKDLNEVKNMLPYAEYKKLKYEYRTCGIKAKLSVREYANELLSKLKNEGYYIIILTSRPVDKYNDLIIQTTDWLHNNNLEYDYLAFSDNKHLEIIQKFSNVEFVVEDNRQFANNIADKGYTVYLLNSKYNMGYVNSNVKRISNLKEIM